MKAFKFSVVMAAYNTAPFLEEAIESLLRQDIGFHAHVQLVLVDDGSTDGTAEICDRYGAEYPENIVVLHKENGGVASAENEGLRHVSGEYVNFMDSDDCLSQNAMSAVARFYGQHLGEIDMVSIPMVFFDGAQGEHILNDKYEEGARVIDLEKEPGHIQLSIASAFVTRAAASQIRFDSRLAFAEDAKACIQVLLRKRKLGVVPEAQYLYRKRMAGERSALQRSISSKSWYLPVLKWFSLDAIHHAKKRLGHVPLFVQFTVMYDLQWKIKRSIREARKALNEQETEEFLRLCDAVLAEIDDEMILGQKYIFPSHKAMLLERKYRIPLTLRPMGKDVCVCCGTHTVARWSECAAKWEFLRIEGETLCLEGYAGFIGLRDLRQIEVWVQLGDGTLISCDRLSIDAGRVKNSEAQGFLIFPAITFRCRITGLAKYSRLDIRLCTKYQGILIERKNVHVGLFFPVVAVFPHAYARVGDWLVCRKGHHLVLRKAGWWNHVRKECRLWRDFLRSGRPHAVQAIFCRAAYWLVRPFAPKHIWLISDRINRADDSGEVFFRYLHREKKAERAYFVLHKDSPDYGRVRQYGRVVPYQSWKHKLLHLLAGQVISSAADAHVMNPFLSEGAYYWDIFRQKRQVFLQHGIIKDDVSEWLNRYQKNLAIFVTSVRREYQSIIEGKYFYGADVVKLTGLPRYDALEDRGGRWISIMPTWRNALGSTASVYQDGIRHYDRSSFRRSQFFCFYDALLNHSRLLEQARIYGYRIQFIPHPNIVSAIQYFHLSDQVRGCLPSTRYQDVFAESSLVVTDYSSVAFDFAYLGKPVVYCQFDRNAFFQEHTYAQGYFDYDQDGFGEVEHDLEGTVERVIEYMGNRCQLKEKYRKRMERFFAFHDHRNCERVYEAVRALDHRVDMDSSSSGLKEKGVMRDENGNDR